MTKNSLRALATAVVFCLPAAALAKAPPAANTAVRASTTAPAAPKDSADGAVHKDATAAHKKHSGKNDAAKTDKNEKSDGAKK